MMWYACGARGLPTPPKVERETQAARDQLDLVGQWLSECIEKTDNAEHFVSNAVLYESYKTWCDENGASAKKIAGLTQALKFKGYEAGQRGRVAGRLTRGCLGVQLVEG